MNRTKIEAHLSLRESIVVRELTRGSATTYLLADALGESNEWPASKYRVHATIQRVRQKFGRDVIITLPGGGYALSRREVKR